MVVDHMSAFVVEYLDKGVMLLHMKIYVKYPLHFGNTLPLPLGDVLILEQYIWHMQKISLHCWTAVFSNQI
jgi:hypothetical protein